MDTGKETVMYQIEDYCEKLQDSLMEYFWNEGEGVFQNHYPLKKEETGFTGGTLTPSTVCWMDI